MTHGGGGDDAHHALSTRLSAIGIGIKIGLGCQHETSQRVWHEAEDFGISVGIGNHSDPWSHNFSMRHEMNRHLMFRCGIAFSNLLLADIHPDESHGKRSQETTQRLQV